MAKLTDSEVKAVFITEMISSGRTEEEAELDWLQHLEDMADYRSVKYGQAIDYSPYAGPDSNWVEDDGGFWGDEDGDIPDRIEPEETVPSHTLKELQLLRNPLPSLVRGLNEPDWGIADLPF